MEETPHRRVCIVCQKTSSKYTCPKCSTPFCSSTCYKKHSNECTEFFYKTHIDENVPVSDVLQDHVKQKTLDVLRREGLNYSQHDGGEHTNNSVISNSYDYDGEEEGENQQQSYYHHQDEGSDGSSWGISDRLYKLALSDNLDIDDLSPEERNQFRRALVSGSLSKYVPEWEPWWKKSEKHHHRIVHKKLGKTFIQEMRPSATEQDSTRSNEVPDDAKVGETEYEDSQLSKEDYRAAQQLLQDVKQHWKQEKLTPSIKCCPRRIPLLSELSSGEISSELTNDIVNILLSYAYTVRTYYGDMDSNVEEAAEVLVTTSSVLHQKQHFATLAASVHEAVSSISRLDFSLSRRSILRTASMLLSDVREILSCSTFFKDAMWDCYRIVAAAKTVLKKRCKEAPQVAMRSNIYKGGDEDEQVNWAHRNLGVRRRKYKELERKLWFLLAFVSDSTKHDRMEELRDGTEYLQKEYQWKIKDEAGGPEYENIVSSNATSQVPFISTLENSQVGKKQEGSTATNLSEID